jgi:hypothetical protein
MMLSPAGRSEVAATAKGESSLMELLQRCRPGLTSFYSRQAAKRQRTSSPSPSSLSKPSNPVSQPASDDESKAKTNGSAKKQPRVTSARNQRDKDAKEEEVEPERPETATRRKSRPDRRKGDGKCF